MNNKSLTLSINNKNFYSTNSINPILTYVNMDKDKALILKQNKNKAGVYRLTNLVNSNCYVGSAQEIRTRFYAYYSFNRLIKSNMIIYKAILKYGYSNFRLDILEYCEKTMLLSREQHYIDLFKPEYNSLKIARSSLGYKHTSDTLEKFKLRETSDKTRANLSKAATNRVLSEDTKTKISLARKNNKLSELTKSKLSDIAIERNGIAVEVTNVLTGEVKQYPTLTSAALALNVSRTAISKSLVLNRRIKKTYVLLGLASQKV